MPKQIPLLGPRMPFKGAFPDPNVSQAAAPDGRWQDVRNLRGAVEAMYVRKGIASLFTAPVPSGCATLVDWWGGQLNGNEVLLGAFRETGGSPKIRIYYFQNSGGLSSGSSWTELTAASGSYGNTRLNNSTRVTFCKMHNDFFDQADGVYISNGTEVRFYNAPNLYPVANVSPPTNGEQFKTIATYGSYWAVAASSGKTYTNSGANFTLANTSSAPYTSANTCILLTRNTTAATNPTAQVAFSSGLSVTRDQFWMVLEGTSTNIATFLDRIKIELSDGSTYVTIYDRSSTSSQFGNVVGTQTLVSGTTQIQHVVFGLESNTASIPTSTTTIRLTWVGAAPTASVTLNILGMGLSGRFPGTSQWGIAYVAPGYVESGGYLDTGLAETPLLSAIGGPTQVTGSVAPPNLGNPNGSFLYDYELMVSNGMPGSGSTPSVTAGMAYAVNVYYRLAPGVPFQFHTPITFATPGGTYNSANVNVKLSTYASDWSAILNGPEFATDGISLPSGGNVAPPASLCSAQYANRLFLGNVYYNSSSKNSEVWFSWEDQMTRFQPILETDENGVTDGKSGGVATMPGTVLGILHTGGQSAEVSMLYVFTSTTAYTLGGINRWTEPVDAGTFTKVAHFANHGVAGYRAYCAHLGMAYVVDQDGRLVLLSASKPILLGFNKFDVELQNVPASYKGEISLVGRGPRVYVGYTPSGGTTNTRMLVYNTDLRELEAIDTSGSESFQRLVMFMDSFASGSQSRLLVFSATGKIGALEESNTGDFGGTGISASVLSNRFVTDNNYWYIGQVRISGEKDAGATATITRFYGTTNTWVSTLNLVDPDGIYPNQFDCADSLPNPVPSDSTTPQGAREASVSISWTGTPSKRIDGITVEIATASVGAGSR